MEALWNKIQQLEKEAATQRQMEVMQMRFDRQDADRKIELHKQEAQARCDKLQALLEKGEAKAEMEKRDARCDKLEMKAEMDKLKMKAEIDKRDARCDKLEMKAEMDKRDAQVKYDQLEVKAEMMKGMLLQQQQIAQLKWEARPGQAPTPQVVYSSPPPPLVAPPPQVAPPSYILQQTHQPSVNPAVLLASPPLQHALPKNMQGVERGAQKIRGRREAAVEKPSSQIAVADVGAAAAADVAVADTAVSGATAVVTPAAKSVTLSSQQYQKPSLPMPEHPPSQQQPSLPPSHSHSTNVPAPVRLVLQQSHHSNNKVPASAGV
jgi:hypothetical protein